MARRRGTKQRAWVAMPDGTEFEVSFGLAEIVAWEKNNKGRGFYDASGEIHASRQAWAIWAAVKKAGHTELRFEDWLPTVDDLGVIDPNEDPEADDASDPTDGSTPES